MVGDVCVPISDIALRLAGVGELFVFEASLLFHVFTHVSRAEPTVFGRHVELREEKKMKKKNEWAQMYNLKKKEITIRGTGRVC